MWQRSSVNLTPNIEWRRRKTPHGDLYLAEGAPEESQSWLTAPSHTIGTRIGGGLFGQAYRVEADNRFVLKESTPPFPMPPERWSRYCGLGALSLNVALQTGLEEIGDKATLPSGAKIKSPQNHALLIGNGITRMLMSFETGVHPTENDPTIGSAEERKAVYDMAVQAVGVDPSTITSYDDKLENLLVRSTGSEFEVVKIDSCNWPIAD